jgi:hypothetical protein
MSKPQSNDDKEKYRIGSRVRDTPGADPQILFRASSIARTTYLSAAGGFIKGAMVGVAVTYLLAVNPLFPKHRIAKNGVNMTAGLFGGGAFGGFLASATAMRNAVAVDIHSNAISEQSKYQDMRTDYQKTQVAEHNRRQDDLDDGFARRKKAIDQYKKERERHQQDDLYKPPRA